MDGAAIAASTAERLRANLSEVEVRGFRGFRPYRVGPTELAVLIS